MNHRNHKKLLALLMAGMFVVAFTACATAPPPENVKAVSCAAKKIQWEVIDEAEVVDFGCSLGKHGMDPALIFTMELKNVSDKPMRFRVNIFLEDMDKAAGHLVPRKGNPPVVEPGKAVKIKIPFIKTTAMSNKILVIVKASS